MCKGAVLGITTPSAWRKVTSCTRNCTVRVRTFRLGIVYSPTRRRKKNAVVTKSAVARVSAVFGAVWYAPARSIVATGIASCGCGAGS
jgi:hypothetical protein